MSTTPDDRPAAPDRPIADTDEMPLDAAVPSSARPAKAGDLTPGTMLGSLYRVIDKLGEGGMGTVYEVEHVRMQKRFAGKVLRRELCTPEHVMRFEREAMAASRIEHPNIVRVVNFDETDDGQVFLICELLSGQDLSMIVRQQAMPVREALNVAFQVASALEATHAEGIIHRDLKPENIFLTERMGETLVKVLDFGVSKVSFGADKQRLTDAGSVVGTPIYMSPENAQGQDDLDARADIYSLGVILYEMVTGTVPFFGTKALDIMFQHIHKAPEPPSVRRDELPADIDALILKALQKAPADRYHSMAEFKEELRQLGKRFGFSPVTLPEASLDGIPQFETPGPVSLTARRPRSGSIHPAILGAAAVVGLIGALFAMLAGGPETAARRARRAAASKPAPATSAVAARVDVRLDSEPAGAEIYADDKLLGVTPLVASLERSDAPMGLRFVKEGHEVQVESLVTSKQQEVTATLRPRPVPKTPAAAKARVKPRSKAPVLPKIKTSR